MKNKLWKEYETIESEFYDLDAVNKKAKVCLHYDRVEDIIDANAVTKIPVMTSAFEQTLSTAFDSIPKGYKLDLDVAFDDMDGYTSEELDNIFNKNLFRLAKTRFHRRRFRNRIAVGLIILGFVFFVAMMLVKQLWTGNDLWHNVFFYMFDIATTVLFWEAAGILLVEGQESRMRSGRFLGRFADIHFHAAE